MCMDIKASWRETMENLTRRLQQEADRKSGDCVVTVQLVVTGGQPVLYGVESVTKLEPANKNVLSVLAKARKREVRDLSQAEIVALAEDRRAG